jgi:hypothetical protein
MKKSNSLILILFFFFSHLPLLAKDDLPDWIKNRGDTRFSNTSYLQAVGQAELGKRSDEAIAQAELMAKNQIAEQLQVHIASQSRVVKFESTSANIFTEQSAEELQSATQITLSGLRIEANYIDRKNKICYALAVLDRKVAANAMYQEISTLKQGAQVALETATDLIHSNKPLSALSNIRRAYLILMSALEREQVLYVLKPSPAPLMEFPSQPTIEQMLAELHHTGASVRVVPLQNSVTLQSKNELPCRLEVTAFSGDQPLANLPLICQFRKGRGQAEASDKTNDQGQTIIWIRGLGPAPHGEYLIEILPDVSPYLISEGGTIAETWNLEVKQLFHPAIFSLKRLDLDLDDYCAAAAQDLATQLLKNRGECKLAVGNITYAETAVASQFIAYLKEKISAEMAIQPNMKLIAPDKIESSIHQAKVSYRGSKRPDSPEVLAALIDADAMVTGNYWDRERVLEFNLYAVQSHSGTVLASSKISIPMTCIPAQMAYLPSNFKNFSRDQQLGDVQEIQEDLKVEVWVDRGSGAVYHKGEKIAVFVRVTRDCYLYLIYHDAEGNDILIYPNARQANNRILGGVIYQIPDARDTFDFVVKPPYGSELIKAVVAKEIMPELPGKILANGLKVLAGSFKDNLTQLRGIKLQSRPSGYAEASCVLTTMD